MSARAIGCPSEINPPAPAPARLRGMPARGIVPHPYARRSKDGAGGTTEKLRAARFRPSRAHFRERAQVLRGVKKLFSVEPPTRAKCIAPVSTRPRRLLRARRAHQTKTPADRQRGQEGRRGNEHWRESQTRASLGGPLLCRSSAYQTTS